MYNYSQLKHESELHQAQITVGELAESLYSGQTYDCALPQLWVDDMRAKGFEVRGRFVWLYPEGNCLGKPAPLTYEAAALLDLLSLIMEGKTDV